MTNSEYIQKALRTDLSPAGYGMGPIDKLQRVDDVRLLHGAMGVCTEAGELLDAMKKYLMYNKPLDAVNMKEEIGDIFWYLAIICDELGLSFEECMSTNIKKLETRYPDKFTEAQAVNRDLDSERKTLENE